jgi:hypothetical protein
MNIEDYRAIRIKDCEDNNVDYGIIMLNNKHSVKDFQQAINKVKNRYYDEGNLEWQINDILMEKELEELEWFEIPSDIYDYVEV